MLTVVGLSVEIEVTKGASSSEKELRERIRDGGFAIALSGGGHRATLATLGALMAIVDRGLCEKAMQISSVSGGSITNAFVAQRSDFGKLKPFELDDVAAELTAKIVRDGVLTKRWFVIMLFATLLAGIATGFGFHLLILPWAALSTLLGLCAAFVVLIFRGLLVEWLLDRNYFRRYKPKTAARIRSRALLKSLSGTEVDHVFCMTDLVLGLPVYASSQHGGIMYRRLDFRKNDHNDYGFQTFDIGQMSLAEIVRASAAFPGIPPRRKKFPEDEQNTDVADKPRLGYLADGGLWNNLGSQVLREDQIIFTHFAWGGKAIRPYGLAPAGVPLLCINGSAPLKSTQPWAFRVPGLAFVKSLVQTANILNANTVQPRVDAMNQAYEQRIGEGQRPDLGGPVDLIVDLTPSPQMTQRYMHGAWGLDEIAQTDWAVKNWEKKVLMHVRLAHKSMGDGSKTDWTKQIFGIIGPEPKGSYPVCGLANFDDREALRLNADWKKLAKELGTGEVDAPTTLSRIDADVARRLIGRSYLNTYYVSLFLAPLNRGELDGLKNLSKRIDAVVGGASP